MSKEAKLGLFVIAVLMVFLFFTINMGTMFFSQGTRTFRFFFKNIATLEKGAPVKQAGFDVGEVSSIALATIAEPTPTKYIIVEVRVNDEASISTDSRAYILTLGMMGEKYLDISFGQGNPATSDDRLAGQSQAELDQVINQIGVILEEFSQIVEPIRKFMERTEVFDNIDQIVANMKNLTQKLNAIFGGQSDSIETIMTNLEAASADLSSMIATAEIFIVDTHELLNLNKDNINKTFENTAYITQDIRENLVGNVNQIMVDLRGFASKLDNSMSRANSMIAKLETLVDENRPEIQQSITNFKEATKNAKQASARFNHMLNQEEGLVHDLFYDAEFSATTKATIQKASRTLESINSIPDRISFQAEFLYFSDRPRFDSNDNSFRGDLGIQFEIDDSMYVFLGGNNLGSSNDLEAQLGYHLGRFSFHGGIIESEIGAGIDWHLLNRLTLGFEGVGLTDSGEERLDVYSRYRLWEELYFTGGLQDVTDELFPFAGVLVKF